MYLLPTAYKLPYIIPFLIHTHSSKWSLVGEFVDVFHYPFSFIWCVQATKLVLCSLHVPKCSPQREKEKQDKNLMSESRHQLRKYCLDNVWTQIKVPELA